MKIKSGKTLAISFFLGIVADMSAQATRPQINVGLVNTADMDPKALNAALKLAAMIVSRTGVELLLVDCSHEKSEPAPPCAGFTGPSQISIRLIRRLHKGSSAVGFGKLGRADRLEAWPGSGSVYVFCEMIEAVAKDRMAPLQDILGVVVAHEIGHLLIGPGHSATGLMQRKFRERQWGEAAQGTLRFTPWQAEIIRNGALNRNRHDQKP